MNLPGHYASTVTVDPNSEAANAEDVSKTPPVL
jgi:hypothetical protein